jgi:Legionella pneumophila major outer membrane protein precursor
MKLNEVFMKKNHIMGAITLIALSFAAKPFNKTDIVEMYKQMPADEKLAHITTVNYRDDLGVITSDASPNLNKAHGYMSASALLMNILTDAQDVSLYTYENTSVTPVTKENGYQNNNWGWNWGVKAALGFRVCDDGWDLSFNFAYLQATKRQHNQANSSTPVKTIYPLSGVLTTLSFNNRYNQAATNQTAFDSFKLRNNFLIYDSNIDLAREFFVSKKLSLKPLAGIKGTLIEQKAYINFINGATANQLGTFTNKNNYWGVGPQAGAGIRFGFAKHMSFNCQLDGALLWGQIRNKEMYLNYTAEAEPVALNCTYKANRYQLVPNFNIYAGFIFDTNFSHDTKNIAFNVGYENRYFLNSIDTANSVTRAKGSTSLQGFTAGLWYSY